jgi:hypothetical protein
MDVKEVNSDLMIAPSSWRATSMCRAPSFRWDAVRPLLHKLVYVPSRRLDLTDMPTTTNIAKEGVKPADTSTNTQVDKQFAQATSMRGPGRAIRAESYSKNQISPFGMTLV